MDSVGIVIIAKDSKRFLLLHRVTKPIVWSILTGTMDVDGETPEETVRREIREEIGESSYNKITGITQVGKTKNHGTFNVFVGFTEKEFTPDLKMDENDEWGWYTENDLPKPIHNKWDETFGLVKKHIFLEESISKIIKRLLKS